MAASRLLIGAAAMALLANPCAAQVANSSGSRVVMDPDTHQVRVVNPGLDGPARYTPPSYSDLPPIVLKKPQRHKPKPAAPKMAETPPAETPPQKTEYAPPPETSTPKPAPEKTVEKPKPAPAPAVPDKGSAIPFSLGGNDNYRAAPPAARRQALATPPAAGQAHNIHINFAPGASAPSPEAAASLKSLAGDLTSALQSGSRRLLLQAFAGAPGDKSSAARRLSLKRALSVRQLLIDSGVPSDRIDVRAMGGVTDTGQPDRVDLLLQG